jgi:hypothetical protein
MNESMNMRLNQGSVQKAVPRPLTSQEIEALRRDKKESHDYFQKLFADVQPIGSRK